MIVGSMNDVAQIFSNFKLSSDLLFDFVYLPINEDCIRWERNTQFFICL